MNFMQLLTFTYLIPIIGGILLTSSHYVDNQLHKNNLIPNSTIKSPISDDVPNEDGQYILHRDKIDIEIQLLKEKYPVLSYDMISYKFLFAPKQGHKQFFESDGSPFVVLKIYSRNTRPGDMITISEVKYKEPADSTNSWKNFGTTLLFVFE
jgi:hypothetical protein